MVVNIIIMDKLKCHKCGYEWETNSRMIRVSCPSCQIKTPNTSKNIDSPIQKIVKQKKEPRLKKIIRRIKHETQ